VTLVIGGEPVEVTTLRQDVETFGRKARVAFGRDWAGDAARRDFTINALSVTAGGTVHDSVGGLADIAARRVRFIGEPGLRIAEDFLRILRFFRIHAAFGSGDLDRPALIACIEARDGLATLSAERIRMELLKLMAAPGAPPALVAMDDGGLLVRLLGGVAYHGALAAMVAIERRLALAPDPIRRLGALAVAVPEDARRLAQRLRLSNVEARRLDAMGHRWWRLKDMDEATARRRLYRIGPEGYHERLLLAWARAGRDADPARWRELAALPQRWQAPEFPLKAADFIARGVAEGPDLGRVLALAEDAWLAADFPAGPAAVAAIADDAVARLRRDAKGA
jgi:poly(A) polymerase